MLWELSLPRTGVTYARGGWVGDEEQFSSTHAILMYPPPLLFWMDGFVCGCVVSQAVSRRAPDRRRKKDPGWIFLRKRGRTLLLLCLGLVVVVQQSFAFFLCVETRTTSSSSSLSIPSSSRPPPSLFVRTASDPRVPWALPHQYRHYKRKERKQKQRGGQTPSYPKKST